jgi:ribosomal protein S6
MAALATLRAPIDRFFEGVYILNRVAMPPQGTAEVDRVMRLNEDIIRFLIVRTNN